MDFAKLGLKKEIIDLLARLGFKEPLEVQQKIIPLALSGKNVVFISRTGSGKTLAYLLGFLSKIKKTLGVQMVVLVPTRELCLQVGQEMRKVCDPLDLKVGIFYGGKEGAGEHAILSRKNQIVVGTPGRLLEHINSKKLIVGEAKYLVFDESDQMFDNRFYDYCVYVKKRLSRDAQIILASATISNRVNQFIEEEIGEHELLKIGVTIPKNIIQEKTFCGILEKNEILLKLLSQKRFKRAIIFCNTKLKSENIARFFRTNKFSAISLNGDLIQAEREEHLRQFRRGNVQILVATDVAARGLHIENVDIVVNYDVPTRDEFYVHRIGRAGRNDKNGYALTLVCPEDLERFENIEFEYNLDIKEVKS